MDESRSLNRPLVFHCKASALLSRMTLQFRDIGYVPLVGRRRRRRIGFGMKLGVQHSTVVVCGEVYSYSSSRRRERKERPFIRRGSDFLAASK